MKSLLLILSLFFLTAFSTYAQTGREVKGTVVDSTKLSLPGSSIKLVSNGGDSTITIADANGKFSFPSVKGSKITLTFSSIGFTSLKKHFTLDAETAPVDLGNIIMQAETNMLNQVNIVGTVPVTLKEDTVQYQASAYKVRDNAAAEDLIKKLPGVDVDANGNVSTQGKQVTKVRINGKDYMGGDVQSATKNLPADIIENIQMIDDYGDQANLTGVKTGEPDKIMNITIRKDKNYGYSAQATAGDGQDVLPKDDGVANKNRYIGSVNIYNFNGDQQISVLGSINNTNVNTFTFGSNGNSAGGGGRGGNRGGGGGFGNSSLATTRDGITNARSIGVNFRDQWGKNLAVYGGYSFADNTTSTINSSVTTFTTPRTQQSTSNAVNETINHRFNWNMEYKPDTINYLKVTPTFSYGGTNSNSTGTNTQSDNGALTSAYTSAVTGDSQAPSYGLTALFNHKIKNRRNLSIGASVSSAPSWAFDNPVYNYTVGPQITSPNQMINTYTRTVSYGANLSYLEPLGKRTYLELNYAINHSITNNNKETDILANASDPANLIFLRDSALSSKYNYNFTTNRIGLNYRFIEKKYNYTLGLAVQPSVLDGMSIGTDIPPTHRSTFNIIPTARYVYNFSRSQTFSVNYNGSNSAPSFSQLQPVLDFSDALNPVQGNPDLKPQFTNNVSIRYNNFSFATGDVFFANVSYKNIQDYVATNTTTFPRVYTPDTRFNNTILTQYVNASGYYQAAGRLTYAKPWEERRYTLTFNGTVTYTNDIGYQTSVDSSTFVQNTLKNISKNLALTPEIRFRTDITNVIDAQLSTSYAINKTDNSVKNAFTDATANVRTWNIGLNGKNYFGDWTFSYDYTKVTNYGVASTLKVTNPNILNVYLERMFLKNKVATIRLAAYDLFNQNTGFSVTPASNGSITQSNVNRLSRYVLLTFTLRLKKFAGKAPVDDPDQRRMMRGGQGGGPGGNGGGPGGGGPGGGGPGGGGPGGMM